MDDYLNQRANLVSVVLVMDARHPLKPFDKDMIDWCRNRSMPSVVLLNKADKLNRGQRAKALRTVEEVVPLVSTALLFSAVTGLGAPEAIELVRERLQNATMT